MSRLVAAVSRTSFYWARVWADVVTAMENERVTIVPNIVFLFSRARIVIAV
jgi:hypothetical protein